MECGNGLLFLLIPYAVHVNPHPNFSCFLKISLQKNHPYDHSLLYAVGCKACRGLDLSIYKLPTGQSPCHASLVSLSSRKFRGILVATPAASLAAQLAMTAAKRAVWSPSWQARPQRNRRQQPAIALLPFLLRFNYAISIADFDAFNLNHSSFLIETFQISWSPVVVAVVLKCLKLQQCICMGPSCRLSASSDDCCGGDHAWVQRHWTFNLHLPTSKCAMSIHLDQLVEPKRSLISESLLVGISTKYVLKNHFFSISVCIFLLSSCKMPPTSLSQQNGDSSGSSKKTPSGSERFGPLPYR